MMIDVLKRHQPGEGCVLMFTGHMIDAPEREQPRFPANMETLARAYIREAVRSELSRTRVLSGLASGASGGDILFHEVCLSLDIGTQMYLALPPKEFIAKSVAPAGPEWVQRFVRLVAQVPVHVLPEQRVGLSAEQDVWERCNLWMLDSALKQAADDITLIALWDGKSGDGPGGTGHMVELAQSHGTRSLLFNTDQIFGLGSESTCAAAGGRFAE